ncbi:MAG TPA: GNAT family N-acetyltransferase, partial [Microlunatus sp.]|nr:GNAT family N-acetyltransferase [Microlunatus sp.]
MPLPVDELARTWAAARTPRLLLRRPSAADRDVYVALHADPRLWTHAPHLHTSDPVPHQETLAGVLRHWQVYGFGYWVVDDATTGEPIGVAGVRTDGDGLNLYYRFAAEAHGRGLATEVAKESVALASEWLGDRVVRATIRPQHRSSLRVAERAGLVEVGSIDHPDDPPDEPPSRLWQAPRCTTLTVLSDDVREEALDLWAAVNADGGAVGFPGEVPRADVVAALAGHESAMAAGMGTAVLLREPGGRLVGLGFVERIGRRLFPHVVDLKRVMVAPDRRGRSLGRLLMAGLHRAARELGGIELIRLDYRSGTGV